MKAPIPFFVEQKDFPKVMRDRLEARAEYPLFKSQSRLLCQGPLAWSDGREPRPRRLRLGIIGTRKPSSYGLYFVAELLRAAKNLPLTIVSGGALGIDGEAHARALLHGLPTEAWVVGPIAKPNPAYHERLFYKMLQTPESGLVVPEFLEPQLNGRNPLRADWLTRNQWLSMSLDALLVVEAGIHSGTWNKVKFSQSLGIPIWALPGEIFQSESSGTNLMITMGYAHPVESVGFLLKAFVALACANSYNRERG